MVCIADSVVCHFVNGLQPISTAEELHFERC